MGSTSKIIDKSCTSQHGSKDIWSLVISHQCDDITLIDAHRVTAGVMHEFQINPPRMMGSWSHRVPWCSYYWISTRAYHRRLHHAGWLNGIHACDTAETNSSRILTGKEILDWGYLLGVKELIHCESLRHRECAVVLLRFDVGAQAHWTTQKSSVNFRLDLHYPHPIWLKLTPSTQKLFQPSCFWLIASNSCQLCGLGSQSWRPWDQ